MEWPQIILEIVSMAFAALGIYVAIRIDMAILHEKIKSGEYRIMRVEDDMKEVERRVNYLLERRPHDPHI
jgi:hypothetical protein